VHEEGSKENPHHIPVEGEFVQLLELVKACYTSKRARDYVLELSNLVKGLHELYTRNVQQRVKLHCLFRAVPIRSDILPRPNIESCFDYVSIDKPVVNSVW